MAAVRLLVLSVCVVVAVARGRDPLRILTAWDGQWYGRIAEDGYGFVLPRPDGRVYEDYAFFPLLPALERAVGSATGLGYAEAGLMISAVSVLAAAWGIFAVGDLLHGRRAGVVAAVLWAAVPISIVQSLPYSESLFTALAAWALYCTLTGRWVAAGALAATAGLTRPTAAALAFAVMVAAVTAMRRDTRTDSPAGPPPGGVAECSAASARRAPAPLAGLLLAPLGTLGYLLFVAVDRGDPLGYFEVADGWGNGVDGGAAFAAWTWGLLRDGEVLAALGVVAALGVLGLLLWSAVRARQPPPLLVYTMVLVALALSTSGFFASKPRHLLPAFPLLLPLGARLARLGRARTGALLAALAGLSAAYGAWWLLGGGPL